MPNLNNLESNPRPQSRLLQARREDILYREDLRTGFFYVLTGLVISLAIAGGVYVIGKKLIA